MAYYYYLSMLVFSLILLLVYVFIFHKHFDANITILVVLVPIINLGFFVVAKSTVIEEALIGQKLTYLGGCFLLPSAMFLIFNTCNIRLRPWMKVVFIALSTIMYSGVLTIGHLDIFYVGKPDLEIIDGAAYLANRHYGFMHTLFNVMMGIYYAITIGAIIFAFIKKKQVPRRILFLLILSVTIAMIGFFGRKIVHSAIEFLPATYNLGLVTYMLIASRLRLYNASDSVVDSLVQRGETGFISFDNKMRYLGSNETAKAMFPELRQLVVDHPANQEGWIHAYLLPCIEKLKENKSNNRTTIERDGKYYLVHANPLLIGKIAKGYQFLITDDTANQEYIKLIQNYNAKLEDEVVKKTKDILDMQDQLVLGMATMVEGRDNSTGGHIKRTSDAIRILIDEIKNDNSLQISDEFCKDLIKAAPMHDLGKIAVDDAILRKPGKYTPEEFEVMKSHASEGARIVSKILEGTKDQVFAKIAINVAHYHHERYDGSGYPCKLKGEEIPLEARIMAIADVYDALVSKRVYKEKMSFEQADKIIIEGMGKHFDPKLQKYYEHARTKLEAYYTSLDC